MTKSQLGHHAVVEVAGLRKEYKNLRHKTMALDSVSFTIRGPGVYGLLGPNGSGKTTTIRCLLGLVKPTAGAVRILGADISELATVIGRVGALVESPKFSPNMSGRVNRELFAAMSGTDRSRVDKVLDLVQLSDRSDEPVKAYSLGMTQRLGIAAAMLNDPELVILDEPTNGLDPAGMADVRRLLRELANDGRTVIVSSHQLHEIQQVCDQVIIFQNGNVVLSGTVQEIVGACSGRRVVVMIENRAKALEVLGAAGFNTMPALAVDQLIVQLDGSADAADVNQMLANHGLYAHGIAADTVSLEDAFLSITSNPSIEKTLGATNVTTTFPQLMKVEQ